MPKVYYGSRGEESNDVKGLQLPTAKKQSTNGSKDWAILDQQFRHDLKLHCDVFAAIAVLSQIAIQHNGEELFQVEYSDQMRE